MRTWAAFSRSLTIPILFRAAVVAAAVLAYPVYAASAVPGSDRALADSLNGSDLRVLSFGDGRELRRGTVFRAELVNRCTLRLRVQGEDQHETVRLGDLRFVQGDGVRIDIAARSGGERELILDVGVRRYPQAVRLLTSRATSCGARLAAPPPIVATRP